MYHTVHAPIHSVIFHVDKWRSVAFTSGLYDLQQRVLIGIYTAVGTKINLLVRMLCGRNAVDNGNHKEISHCLKITATHISML
jgi:hypothetical protein